MNWIAQIKGPSPKADIGGGVDIPKTLGGGTLKEMGKDASNAVSSAMHLLSIVSANCVCHQISLQVASVMTGIITLVLLWLPQFAMTEWITTCFYAVAPQSACRQQVIGEYHSCRHNQTQSN